MFVRYSSGSGAEWGIQWDGDTYALDAVDPSIGLTELTNSSVRDRLRRRAATGALRPISIDEAKLLAPTERPSKLVVVGLNFVDRAEEYGRDIPDHPILYGKAASAVSNPRDPIVYPDEIEQLDYEVELAVVMGRQATDVPERRATDYVAGYTVVNDVSARDAHAEDDVAFRGNSYDTFAPLGPVLVPPNHVADDATLRLSVNGETKQESSLANVIFDVPALVEYISDVMTLYPGDVICTGTPGGAGIYRDPPELLEPGDTVEASVESVGTLVNEVVPESADD